MAHKESGEIAVGSSYQLGEYTFSLQTTVSEGERVIQAHCSGPEGNAAKGISVPTSTQIEGWYVEANDTSADVYVDVKEKKGGNPFNLPDFSFVSGFTGEFITFPSQYRIPLIDASLVSKNDTNAMAASLVQTQYMTSFTYDEKTVYYWEWRGLDRASTGITVPLQPQLTDYEEAQIAWTMIYGDPTGKDEIQKTILVARFAIDLGEAGGYPDGGGDWDEEGDYDSEDYPDPDEREPDDPTYTLYLNVTGALSGRHNDPLHDTSYSYLPSDKATKKPYGCGGDGGHGGGGGGGASTVVVKKFATNRADSKDITISAKRHGYGSGGGKGGKGGDGIVLIYY